ncbi:MAG TPA: hypothetical protein VM266_13155 [Solirubrobacteraceae bacterium]|nr:hypothetical protein [Solirubrobacteraceae bacterium]
MAQTKRKRRNKHRGNAVGVVEARGRTSKPRDDAPRASGRAPAGRGGRTPRPATWKSAALKAAFGAIVLFAFARLGVLGSESTTSSAATLAVMAMVFYTPIMFFTDRFIYERRQKQMNKAGQGRR